MKTRDKPGSRRGRKRMKKRVELLPPSDDAARDEGPRLIPLGDRTREPSRLEHYLDLADRALTLKKRDRKAEAEAEAETEA
jgi:hypothetical protein